MSKQQHIIVRNGVRITMPLNSAKPIRLEIFSQEVNVEVDYMEFNKYCEVKMKQRFGENWLDYANRLDEVVCESKVELVDLFVTPQQKDASPTEPPTTPK